MISIAFGGGFLLFRKFKKLRIYIVILAIVFPLLFAYKTGDFKAFVGAGRGPVWKETAQLIIKQPMGYGIATYKILFQHLCSKEILEQQINARWARAHNDWLQMPFELGIPGFLLFLGWVGSIAWSVRDPIKQTGLIIIGTNMLVHFPERMTQSVLIILMFLAMCSMREQRRV